MSLAQKCLVYTQTFVDFLRMFIHSYEGLIFEVFLHPTLESNFRKNCEPKNLQGLYNLGSRWSGSLFRLMVDLFCQLYSPINGITCKTKYNVHTKKYYLEMFVAKSSIQKVEMMHISQLYVLSINIDGITRTIRWKNRKHIWWETLQHITKHQRCLQHLLWHQKFSI